MSASSDWSPLCAKVFGNELILSNILSGLELKELTNSCLRVNHLWLHLGRKAIQNRNRSQHFFELYRIGRHHNMADDRNRETHLPDGTDLSFVSNSFEEIESKISLQIKTKLDVWPHLMITFYGNFCPHSRRPERLMNYNLFRKYLAPETQFLNVVSTAGLIGSVKINDPKKGQYEPIETQAQVGNCAGVSLLILPKYPNVEIDIFDDRNLIVLEKLNSRDDLKCLIVFATDCVGKTHEFKEFQSVNQLKNKYNHKIAIGGIITDEINHFNNNLRTTRKKSRDFYGIAFSGPKVKACSLLFNTITPEATERKLLEFRNNLGFETKQYETIGFMFICTGRGIYTEGYSNTSNIEANMFAKVFPDVKLVGVFGQGEFGHNYWPSLDRNQQLLLSKELEESKDNGHELWHFYTSVLVLVNLPKK